jgi:hypothetical protein
VLQNFSHSLGGALAILEALDLYQRDKRFTASNLGVYTFGMNLFQVRMDIV